MMELEALGNIGEFVGSIAVVITLIFLTIQMRQNNEVMKENARLTRAQTRQMTVAMAREFERDLAMNEKVRNTWMSGIESEAGYDALSDDERLVFALLVQKALRGISDDHYRFTIGLLEEEEWNEMLYVFRTFYVSKPGFRHHMKNLEEEIWNARFKTFVNDEISKVDA